MSSMVSYDFWNGWKHKTRIEKRAIKSVEKARALVLTSIPENKLVAIYIKGSFVRREMKKGSDVDIVPIVAENKYQHAVFGVNGRRIMPVMVVPLSLWEFRHNRLWTKSDCKPDLRAKPDRLLKKIKDCKLIYGKPLDPRDYPIRNDRTALKDEIKLIKNGYIPYYAKGKVDFNSLLKEVFWLVELEQSVLGKNVHHSFAGIKKSVVDSDHIIHDAFSLRKSLSKNKRKKFIQKLKKYLEEARKK